MRVKAGDDSHNQHVISAYNAYLERLEHELGKLKSKRDEIEKEEHGLLGSEYKSFHDTEHEAEKKRKLSALDKDIQSVTKNIEEYKRRLSDVISKQENFRVKQHEKKCVEGCLKRYKDALSTPDSLEDR